MSGFISSLIAGLVSGTVISTIIGILLRRRTIQIEEEIKNQFQKSMAVFRSTRDWKEKSISELLGPMYMQFDRTGRAFERWRSKDLFLEAKVIREGNLAIRDLLLAKGHLIPSSLLEEAGKLIEHYDRWLEEYEKKRLAEEPDLETPFIFVGPAGYPFPKSSETKFREAFKQLWTELYDTGR